MGMRTVAMGGIWLCTPSLRTENLNDQGPGPTLKSSFLRNRFILGEVRCHLLLQGGPTGDGEHDVPTSVWDPELSAPGPGVLWGEQLRAHAGAEALS